MEEAEDGPGQGPWRRTGSISARFCLLQDQDVSQVRFPAHAILLKHGGTRIQSEQFISIPVDPEAPA